VNKVLSLSKKKNGLSVISS